MSRMIERLKLADRGSVAVEFALILPVLLVLVVGIFDVSRAFLIRANLQYAVQQAARYGMVRSNATSSSVTADAQGALIVVNAGDPNLSISSTVTSSQVTVDARYNFQFVAPQLLTLVGGSTEGPLTLIAKAQMPRTGLCQPGGP